MNFMGGMCRILRITAWLLVVATLLTMFSGFFTTKFFLTPLGYILSYFIHTVIIPVLFVPLFYLHTLAGMMILLSRHPKINKKLIKATVGIAWTGVLALFIALYAAQTPAASTGTDTGATSNFSVSGTVGSGATSAILTAAEIAKHNSATDCWLIIDGKVYDVTSYLPYHPGGPGQILPYCGSDASAAFADKGGRGTHSSSASSLLGSFFIGNVGGQTTVQAAQGSPTQSQNIPANLKGEDD